MWDSEGLGSSRQQSQCESTNNIPWRPVHHRNQYQEKNEKVGLFLVCIQFYLILLHLQVIHF
ncbi:hypothetical protein CSPX01_06574 [Colletotrichum filicis]|nr:hypothetical protein CSPX01_06574 [Colletotrichum filicis]